MKRSSIAFLTLVTLLCCEVSAHAAEFWTVTTEGTILNGEDDLGIFGVGQNLSGLRFRQSITTDTDPTLWENYVSNIDYNYLSGHGPAFMSVITINDVTLSVSATSNVSGIQSTQDSYTIRRGNYFDIVDSNNFGYTENGDILQAVNLAFAGESFVPILDYQQFISKNLDSPLSSSYFLFKTKGTGVWFGSAEVDYVGVNMNVPEPGSIALVSLAVAGLAFSRRRKA